VEEATQAAVKAVTLAPDLAAAHAILGWYIRMRSLDFGSAVQETDRAMSLAPTDPDVLGSYSSVQSWLGHRDVAVSVQTLLVGLDPRNYRARIGQANILRSARRFKESSDALRVADALRHDSPAIADGVARNYLALGDAEAARRLCESSSTAMNRYPRQYCLTLAYHALGRQKDSLDQLDKIKSSGADPASVEHAGLYAQLGDPKEALAALERAERAHDPALGSLKVRWELDPIRGEPRFKALIERLHFPP
jgi:tetratricopeptide (TPR) repeat protein